MHTIVETRRRTLVIIDSLSRFANDIFWRADSNQSWRWCTQPKIKQYNQNNPNECNQLIPPESSSSDTPSHRYRSPIVYAIVGTPYYAPSIHLFAAVHFFCTLNLSDRRIANNKYVLGKCTNTNNININTLQLCCLLFDPRHISHFHLPSALATHQLRSTSITQTIIKIQIAAAISNKIKNRGTSNAPQPRRTSKRG